MMEHICGNRNLAFHEKKRLLNKLYPPNVASTRPEFCPMRLNTHISYVHHVMKPFAINQCSFSLSKSDNENVGLK